MTRRLSFIGNTEKEYRAWWKKYAPNGVKYGECWCGCGKAVGVYTRTRPELGYIAGTSRRLISGHGEYSKLDYNAKRKRLFDSLPYDMLTDAEIAEDLGVSRYHIKNQRLSRGIRRARWIPNGFDVPIKRQITSSAELMYQIGTIPDSTIAEQLGCGRGTVSRIRKELNIPNRRSSDYVRNVILDEQLIDAAPDREIARMHRTCIHTVRRERRARGLVKRGTPVRCEVCGKTVTRKGSRDRLRYCSHECMGVARQLIQATQCRPDSTWMNIALQLYRARKELRDAQQEE